MVARGWARNAKKRGKDLTLITLQKVRNSITFGVQLLFNRRFVNSASHVVFLALSDRHEKLCLKRLLIKKILAFSR